MKTKVISAPAIKPVSLYSFKDQISVTDSDRDSLLEGYLKAATGNIEKKTGRKLITQTMALILDESELEIKLPFGELQSVVSVVYKDEDGEDNTINSSNYYVEGVGTDEGKLCFVDSYSMPELYEFEPIVITFICGYGVNSSDVPGELVAAITLFAQDLYLGGDDQQETVKSLITDFKNDWGFK